MMLPASTCSPPKRFTPRRLEWESRPFLVLPPAFLCAMSLPHPQMSASAGADVRDLHLSEQLTVILLAQIVRTALELHDRYLCALAVAHDGGEYLAALERRLAHFHVRTLPDEEHLAKRDGGAQLRVELLHAQHAVLAHPILFTARGDDRVHSRVGGLGLRKGRAFYWRTPSRSNDVFPKSNRYLGNHPRFALPPLRSFLQKRPGRLGCVKPGWTSYERI